MRGILVLGACLTIASAGCAPPAPLAPVWPERPREIVVPAPAPPPIANAVSFRLCTAPMAAAGPKPPPDKERPLGSGAPTVTAIASAPAHPAAQPRLDIVPPDAEPSPRPESTPSVLFARHVRIESNGASLGSVATALGKALDVGVDVDSRIAPGAVWVRLPDTTVADLISVIDAETGVYGAVVTSIDGANRLSFAPYRPSRNDVDYAPLETRIIPVSPGVNTANLVDTYCAMYASPRGSASSFDGAVVIRDVAGNLDAVEELAKALAAIQSKH